MLHSPCLATHSHAPCCLSCYFCLFQRQTKEESKNKIEKCPQAPSVLWALPVVIAPHYLSLSLCSLLFQVFVNFAKEQHEEDESQAYDNPVDTSDELPLQFVRTSEEA